MPKTCRQCQTQFEVTDEDRAFYDKVSPVFGGVKHAIPEPTLCPECRAKRRMIWRNDRKLYKRKCDHCRNEILSMYRPDMQFPVYCNSCWFGDAWAGTDSGREFDFSRSFFEQLAELRDQIPHYAFSVQNQENSDYCNMASHLKDCYLIFNADTDEMCMYGSNIHYSSHCLDCFRVYHCELCYEVINCHNCYGCTFLHDSYTSSNCHFSAHLIGCSNCFLSTNLRNKEFYFLNEKLSPEAWRQKVAQYREKFNDTELFSQFLKLKSTQAVPFVEKNNIENSTGDFLENCNDVQDCFLCSGLEHSKFCSNIVKGAGVSTGNMDISYFGIDLNAAYECVTVGHNCQNVCFSIDVWENVDSIQYSAFCVQGCSHLFGCIGLRHKQYCILNKQYTKEEYEALVPKIIEHMRKTGEWGEFFPASISPFGYNETVANEYFPLTREEALAKGFKWSDYEAPKPQAAKTISAENMKKLPDSIDQIPDDVLNWALTCEVSGKLYKIQPAELAFYRKMKLPIPRRHPDIRHADRMALRNPRKLWKRNCTECNVEIETTYSPERPEKVLCERCYLKAVV